MALLPGSRILLNVFILLQLFLSANAFVPDYVLRISVGTIQQDCQPRLSTLVNGTYPGPPIYLEPDVTTWIRVYNDADVNATMVRTDPAICNTTAHDTS